MTWTVWDCDTGIHVVPDRDATSHDLDTLDCICGPRCEWASPDTGETYPNGPLVTHHSLDGREHHEPAA